MLCFYILYFKCIWELYIRVNSDWYLGVIMVGFVWIMFIKYKILCKDSFNGLNVKM